MHRLFIFSLTMLLTGMTNILAQPVAAPVIDKSKFQLVNRNATRETQQVFDVLKEYYGTHILTGACCNVDWNTREAENVYKWTGKWPAINLFDFMNLHASKDVNPKG